MDRKRLTHKWILIGFISTIFLASDFFLSAQSVFASNLNFSYRIGFSSGHFSRHRHNGHGFKRHNRHGFNRHNRHGFNRHGRRGFKRHNLHGFNRHNLHGNRLHSSFGFGLHFGHRHGAIVSLPHFSTAIFIGGHRYYHNHGTYYKRSSCGYYVVPNPNENYYDTKVESSQYYEGGLPNRSESSFVVNIPNSNSGYTEVLIKKSGDGYIGPQGEYYQNFPSIDQLKAMYTR